MAAVLYEVRFEDYAASKTGPRAIGFFVNLTARDDLLLIRRCDRRHYGLTGTKDMNKGRGVGRSIHTRMKVTAKKRRHHPLVRFSMRSCGHLAHYLFLPYTEEGRWKGCGNYMSDSENGFA